MLEILFIRHGETDWNLGRRIMGHKPIPLNECGRTQIERLKDCLKEVAIDAIYTSPQVRATETAELLRGSSKIPIEEVEALAEVHYGPWVGLTFDEVKATSAFEDYHLRPASVQIPGGESMLDVHKRVVSFVEELRREQVTRRIIAVSHADVIKVALTNYLAMALDDLHRIRIDNGSYSLLWLQKALERVLIVNALPHLDGFFEKTSLFAKEYPFKDKQ